MEGAPSRHRRVTKIWALRRGRIYFFLRVGRFLAPTFTWIFLPAGFFAEALRAGALRVGAAFFAGALRFAWRRRTAGSRPTRAR